MKRDNKVDLAALIERECGVQVSPDAIFDVHVKRLHEYKRQHLNLLHILALYRRLLQNPALDIQPRVFIFAAKAAPGYDVAKNIIRAINVIGDHINRDERVGGRLQASSSCRTTASRSRNASSRRRTCPSRSRPPARRRPAPGNMKLALNGALTLGTLDGANIEIREEVGDENIFIFGLNGRGGGGAAREGLQPLGSLPSRRGIGGRDRLAGLRLLHPLRGLGLRSGAPQPAARAAIRSWCWPISAPTATPRRGSTPPTATGTAGRGWRSSTPPGQGRFSSDRTIREYAEEIWNLPQCQPVEPAGR